METNFKKTKMMTQKTKATINDVVIANKMIRTMQKLGLTPDKMLEVIKLASERFNDLKSK